MPVVVITLLSEIAEPDFELCYQLACASQGNGNALITASINTVSFWLWSPKNLKCFLRWEQLVRVALGRLELQPFRSFFLVLLLTWCS